MKITIVGPNTSVEEVDIAQEIKDAKAVKLFNVFGIQEATGEQFSN
jgi:hypothetical protein